MSAVSDSTAPQALSLLDLRKLEEAEKLSDTCQLAWTDTQILVNIDAQRLHLIAAGQCIKSYPVSTASKGVGQIENTGKTPLGLHSVGEKFGGGADPFEIFQSRVSLRKPALPDGSEHFIVGRILWLQGAQPEFNQGKNEKDQVVDSHERHIYIHGTNDIANVGRPVSGGCIRMKPDDVVDLFDRVAAKTPVFIYTS